MSRVEQETLLADFLPYAETVRVDRSDQPLAGLRDQDDAMFVALARQAAADALVTGDADLDAYRNDCTLAKGKNRLSGASGSAMKP